MTSASPLRFLFGVAFEVAAVVAVVALLPRVDLRPGSPPPTQTAAPGSPFVAVEPPPVRPAPPLLTVDPRVPEDVGQRLDRASQALVNSVGTYLASAADEWQRGPAPPRSTSVGRSEAVHPAAYHGDVASSPVAAAPPPPGSFPTTDMQPQPWRRY